jgi:hypothetical protein
MQNNIGFDLFVAKIHALMRKSGYMRPEAFVRCYEDNGLFVARLHDGTRITANASQDTTGFRITVRFGSGHQAMSVI